ncbi:MAG: hypothetical protein LUE92_17110 [Clostridiales bacterium]|nr:hypothetical protein [Clostridiales bacterium]
MRERTRQREEEEEEQKRIHQAYLDTHKCYSIYLTKEENKKRKFCEEHGERVDENAMYILYQVLHQPKVEKEELLDILGERKEKYYGSFGLFEDGQEWLEYCKEWLGVGEEEVYAIGIELYRQYLTLDDE